MAMTDLFGLHSQSSLLLDCSRTALLLDTLLTCQLWPLLYDGSKCHTLREKSVIFTCCLGSNTQGAALLLEHRLFSSFLSLMSAILLLSRQPSVTDISQQFAVIAQLQETIFKMNISPLLLKFNCIGSQSCGFMSGANITLSQLISREGQLQLVSCTVEDAYLFSKVKCPSTCRNGFFSRSF